MALVDKAVVEKMLQSGRYDPKMVTGLTIDTRELTHMKGAKTEGVKAILTIKQPGKPVKQRRHQAGWWPDEKKIECATLYAAMGNYRRCAELTKVPQKTLERWGLEDWWLQTMQKVRREENWITDKKFSSIVDKALDKLVDRIDNGDMVYDIKRGRAVAVPMSGRDLSIVTGTIFDKRQLLRGEATKITQAVNSEEHLKQLAKRFEAYVKSKEPKTIEGEVIDSQDQIGVQSGIGEDGKEFGQQQDASGGEETPTTSGVFQEEERVI